MRLSRPFLRLLAAVAIVALPIDRGHPWPAEARAQQLPRGGKATAATQGDDWSWSIEPDASVRIYHKGSVVIDFSNTYWGANWAWGNAQFKRVPGNKEQYGLVGEMSALKTKLIGRIGFPVENKVEMIYQFATSADVPEAIGGGLIWNFKLDSPTLGGRLPDPELLADQSGWSWKTAPDQAITLRFDDPPAKVYFDRGQKNKICVFFFANQIEAGTHLFRATLQLPEGARHIPAIDELYGDSPDTHKWFQNALNWDGSPVNLSFLNRDDRPAGRHGVVKADGDHFVFEDGTPARFWGANLAAGALFLTPRPNVAKQARRMAQLGYNLMRIHHHDSDWVNPNIFDRKYKDSRHLNTKSFEILDWWIKCLKDEGIYVWIDMQVGRLLKPDDPVTEGVDEIKRSRSELKGI